MTSSDSNADESSDDESDDEFVPINFFPRRQTPFPGLTRRTPRRRFYDSSDEGGITYYTSDEDSSVSSDDDSSTEPPGLISPEDQLSSSDDDSSAGTCVTADSTDVDSDDDHDPPLVEASFTDGPSLSLNNSDKRSVPEDWILLDSESSVSIFCTAGFLTDIHTVPSDQRLRLHGTGGSIDVFEKGTLPDFGVVWYSPHSVANILSFAEVEQRFQISYHQDQHAFHVTHPSGRTLVFARRPPGRLYYFDASLMLAALPSSPPSPPPLPSALVAINNATASSAPVDLSPDERRPQQDC